jgi:hypothetical protein
MKGSDGTVQFARFVTSCVDKSLKVATALYCCWFWNPIVVVSGVIASEVTVASVIVNYALFEKFPEDALIATVPGDMRGRKWLEQVSCC